MDSNQDRDYKNFEVLGGIDIIRKINKFFYDRVYKHPWLSLYFKDVEQQHIENQQTDFMTGALGGPQNYRGRIVGDAHTHINITEELFKARELLLDQAFKEANAPAELINKWKKIDQAILHKILKKSVSECQPRFKTDPILDFKKPN